jgi:GAF domain-containing protein
VIAYLRKLLPGYTPPEIASRGGLAIIRDRILQTLLLVLLILTILFLVTAGMAEIKDQKWSLLAVYILSFFVLLLVTTIRSWPYTARSITVLALIFSLGLFQFFDSSLPGELRFYLTVFSILTATLLGLIPGVVAIFLSTATIIFTNLAVINKLLAPQNIDLFLRSPNMINGLFLYLLLSGTVTISVSVLVNGIQSGLKEKEDLAENLEKQRKILQETVQNRTLDIQRRLVQVRTAAEISRTISRIKNPDMIFQQVVELVKERFDLYYVGVFIVDPSRRYAVLRAGTGDAGRVMMEQRHQLAIGGNSMIGWCTSNRQPRIALDVGEEAVRFNNPFLPRTHSEVALPILSNTDVLGAMTVQSERSRAFDQNDIMVLQGIADSLAVAVENANLFNELNRNLEEISSLNRNYLQKAWTEVLSESGDLTYAYESSRKSQSGGPTRTIQVPLTLRDQVIGEVTLETDTDTLTPEDTAFVNAMANQTAIALENARLVQESEWRVYQERKLNEMTAEFYRAVSLEGILKAAAEQLGQLPSVTEVSIQLTTAEALTEQPAGNNGKEHLA